ncbi:MAG: hypothetical protein ACRDS0_28330 [Pseudonocardiaceae bacterium]
MPLDDDLVEVVGLGRAERSEGEVVEYQDVGAGEFADLGVASARMAWCDCLAIPS